MVHGGPSYAMEESSARTGASLQNKVSTARICNGCVCCGRQLVGSLVAKQPCCLCYLVFSSHSMCWPLFFVIPRAATGRAAHESEGPVQSEHSGAV
jgi:hypothetical protein